MDFSQNLFTKACFILLVLDLVIGPPIPCKGSLDGLVAPVSWSVIESTGGLDKKEPIHMINF